MKRKERKYEVVAAAANAGRNRPVVVDSEVSSERKLPCSAQQVIEVSDADYRTLHLPCDALEEHPQQKNKGGRNPRV
jgi:hypothetical protein